MTQVDWQALAQFEDGELQIRLLAELDELMRSLTQEEEDQVLATLPDPLRVLWLIQWLDFEVSQGSLLAYFYNAHGRQASLAVQALTEIGAMGMASVLERALRSMDENHRAWADRRTETDRAGEGAIVFPYKGLPNTDDLVTLTDDYWQKAQDDDWGNRLDDYLTRSVKALAAAGPAEG